MIVPSASSKVPPVGLTPDRQISKKKHDAQDWYLHTRQGHHLTLEGFRKGSPPQSRSLLVSFDRGSLQQGTIQWNDSVVGCLSKRSSLCMQSIDQSWRSFERKGHRGKDTPRHGCAEEFYSHCATVSLLWCTRQE